MTKKKKIIYVGKAVNLKNRVLSYFRTTNQEPKTKALVSAINNIEWIVTDSEIEALILEAELIKRYKPRYNIDWKDDKNYCYIKITSEDYPRVSVIRQVVDDRANYIGPFVDSNAVRLALKTLRRVFPYCTCGLPGDKVCLYYHLKLCPGHGPKYISPKDYQKNIQGLMAYIEGDKQKVKNILKKEMERLAKGKEFEKAAEVRDRYIALGKIRFQNIFEETNEIEADKGLVGLQKYLNLTGLPERIECYDISNISGKMAVGSMIVFKHGLPAKEDYRRFEIKTVKQIDDFAMHKEVQRRRFARLGKSKDQSFSLIPDLIVIDGGKGQLSAAEEMIRPLGLKTRVIGLAKRLEEVFYFEDGNFRSITLPENSEAKFLLQRVRDEAHRFAITYHRNLRTKKLKYSRLDKIDGIGPVTKKKLINIFGSINGVRNASEAELSRIVNKRLAKKIKEEL